MGILVVESDSRSNCLGYEKVSIDKGDEYAVSRTMPSCVRDERRLPSLKRWNATIEKGDVLEIKLRIR